MDEDKKRLCKLLLLFIAFLGLLAILLWLALRPRTPSYSILFISIDENDSTISYNLQIENPNKDSSIYYDDTTMIFLFGQEDQYKVGETTIGSFHQGIRKTRGVSQVVNAQTGALKPLLNAISNATAELNVIVMTRVRYNTWGIKSKFHGLNLNGILPIDSNGKLSGNNKRYPLRRNSKKLGRSKLVLAKIRTG